MAPQSSLVVRGLRLSSREQRQACAALGWLLVSHLSLRGIPYRRIRRAVEAMRPSRRSSGLTSEECARAVARARTLVPAARCLAAALAAECLLRRAGRSPRFVIGVRVDPARQLDAHAWVECDGVTVT